MTIFSGALAGQTLAGTTLAGTTLGGITLEGTTLHDTAVDSSATADVNCQSDSYDPSCDWQQAVMRKVDRYGISAVSFCDISKRMPSLGEGSMPLGCETAEKQKKWPYTSSGLQVVGNTPDCARHGAGWWWSDSDGACIPPLQQKGSVPDCKRHGAGYTWSDAKGECVPPAPQISMSSNSGMIIGAVVVLGVVAAIVASQKKGRYS